MKSYFDSKNNLHVDCTECERWKEQSCSAGMRVKKSNPSKLGCFAGTPSKKLKEELSKMETKTNG